MALFVNTNASSLNAQRQLLSSGNALDTAFKRLSSGFRINSAADDAAGLQISDRLTSQVNGLNQAVRNANDGISVAQVAEGAMDEITTSLQRMRVLTIQSENGINGTADIAALQKEFDALADEITRISDTTKFGDISLLDGTNASLGFLVGANGGTDETIDVTLYNASAIGTFTALDGANATTVLGEIDGFIEAVGEGRAELGAVINRFQGTIRNLSNVSENVSEARGRIRDTDFAKETAELTRAQILQQTSTTVLAQANQRPQAALSLLG